MILWRSQSPMQCFHKTQPQRVPAPERLQTTQTPHFLGVWTPQRWHWWQLRTLPSINTDRLSSNLFIGLLLLRWICTILILQHPESRNLICTSKHSKARENTALKSHWFGVSETPSQLLLNWGSHSATLIIVHSLHTFPQNFFHENISKMTFDLNASQESEWPSISSDQALHYSPDIERGEIKHWGFNYANYYYKQPNQGLTVWTWPREQVMTQRCSWRKGWGLEPQGKQHTENLNFILFLKQEVWKHGEHNIPG